MMKLRQALLLCGVLAVAPGWAFGFEGIRVTLLGTGMSEPQGGPGAVVEAGDEILLFDCGRGSLERLRQAGLQAFDLTAVFLTSVDREQIEGCREIWAAAPAGSAFRGFSVWGPTGTAERFKQLDAELGLTDELATRAFDISDNVLYQPDSLTVTAFVSDSAQQARHFGYRIDAWRRSVVLSPGAGSPENIARYARGVQLMLQEVSARAQADDPDASPARPSPEQAGRLFRASQPYLALYSHVIAGDASEEDLVRRTRRSYRGAVQVGRDLMVIEIQNELQIRSAPSEPRLK